MKLLDSAIYEFAKAFRDDRLSKMDPEELPVTVREGPRTVLHPLARERL